ncbi:MAG: hypothetical protein KBA26_10010 [Candidatus Delongbacteria bacterium]|nr:hypothetical protein [Candidatus Delongbacteria bacterium]
MKEQIVIKDKVSTNYYWRFGEIDAQGEIIQTFCRLDQFNIVKARYSPDGKKIAYMKNANSITISLLSSPDRPVDINFEPSVGYAITAFEWAPNSIDFALSLNQGTQSGIYLYDVTNMILTPVIVSDTTIYLLGDYR